MGLAEIVHGVGEVTAVAIGTSQYDFGAPTQKPESLPWVAVTWTTTTSEAKTHSQRDPADGRLKARGKMRKHIGTCYVLIGQSADIANEDATLIDAAQDILDAFDDDQELMGVGNEARCARAWPANVDRFRAEWDGITYAGLQFEWNALEV